MIAGMALSNQSKLPAFFSHRQVSLKIATPFFPNLQFRKMTCRDWPNPWRWHTENGLIPEDDLPRNGQIPEDDLPRMAKSGKMTYRYREWLNPGRWLAERTKSYDKSELARPQNINYRDLVSPASQFAKSRRQLISNGGRLKPAFAKRDKKQTKVYLRGSSTNWLKTSYGSPKGIFGIMSALLGRRSSKPVPLSHSPLCILATLLLSRDKWSCQASFRTMEEGGRESIFSSVSHIGFACMVLLFFTFNYLLTLTSTQTFHPSDALSRFSHVQKLSTL